ncbi:MAG TPA: methionine adenosyltransferase [Polyangiaceae bacterium]|nr:methionine adenosyltransferase [Polyangiaceae bacterium]
MTGRKGEVELVERKGLGHPDTICDALAEALSRRLCRYYLENFGRICHHNVDKALLSAGGSRAGLGGGEITAPINFFFGGRATARVDGEPVPITELAIEVAREWFGHHLPGIDLGRHLRVHCHVHPTSDDLLQLFERGRAPLANDTSVGVGFAPNSPLERLVLLAEERLNSPEFRAAHPEAGVDVKISGLRYGADITLTVARAFIASRIASADAYAQAKAETAACVKECARELGLTVRVVVNVADTPDRMYLTVLGTSAECADDGHVGRGNRANGLITPHRPMSVEAVAGKNPVNHVGKLYNLTAGNIASDISSSLKGARDVHCYLSSQMGRPLDDPDIVQVEVGSCNGSALDSLALPVTQRVFEHLGRFAQLSRDIIDGKVRLF